MEDKINDAWKVILKVAFGVESQNILDTIQLEKLTFYENPKTKELCFGYCGEGKAGALVFPISMLPGLIAHLETFLPLKEVIQ